MSAGPSAEKRVFDVPATTVVSGVGCVWCCVGVGVPCRENGARIGVPHAQRWREYWNATRGRGEQVPVFTAYGKQVNRIPGTRDTSPEVGAP